MTFAYDVIVLEPQLGEAWLSQSSGTELEAPDPKELTAGKRNRVRASGYLVRPFLF